MIVEEIVASATRRSFISLHRATARRRIHYPRPHHYPPSGVVQQTRLLSATPGNPQPGPNPGQGLLPQIDEDVNKEGQSAKNDRDTWGSTLFKMFENAATTFASIFILGMVGFSYNRYYKYLVLKKVDNAFQPGDPILDLAAQSRDTPHSESHWIERDEQKKVDAILDGTESGHYYLLIGEKGTGKSSMLIEGMAKVNGDGISMFEAHGDVEIFRIRLGKALDFEFHEDNIGSLFSIRGPRDASALLDIERAFNKLEKVALKRRNKGKKPMVLIINSLHLVRDNEDGKDLLELVQQRAEAWAAGNLLTVVFNSDEYWVYERLKEHATRLEVVPIVDLTKDKALVALRKYRKKYFHEDPPEELLEKVYERIGGRLSFLNSVAKAGDMLKLCDQICDREKTWFLNQCWIFGEAMDDDVMNQQKYASAAMVLAKALVEKGESMEVTFDPKKGHILPEIPLHKAREVMTRADFIQAYDSINVFTINSEAMVRADSIPMMNAFREICAADDFDDFLQATLDRISAIESLGRTRELTIKDLWDSGKYSITTKNAQGQIERTTLMEVIAPPEDKK